MPRKIVHIKTTEQKILKFIDRHKLIVVNDHVLLGLSGGVDSVFALHFLLKFRDRLKIKVSAVHINHGLRGKESDEDQMFCENLCKEENVNLLNKTVNVKKEAAGKKKSIEEAARDIRYNVFEEAAKKIGCSKIITAHNLNDNSETVLLNLLKGSGINGLSGIPIKRGNIIRPFLCVSRDEIIDYAEHENMKYRVDSSNLSNEFERNFLRNEIFNRLTEKFGNAVHENIFRTSGLLKSLNAFVSGYSSEVVKKHIKTAGNGIEIENDLFKMDNIVAGNALMSLFYENMGVDFSVKDFDDLKALSNSQTGRTIQLKNDWKALKERSKIVIHKETTDWGKEIKFKAGNKSIFGSLTIGIDEVNKNQIEKTHNNFIEYIDADNLGDIFILRKWKSGDKFKPLGMKHFKKVSDFLTEQKVSSLEKKEYPVLINNGNIVWVPGLRIDDRYKLKDTTTKVLKLWLKKQN